MTDLNATYDRQTVEVMRRVLKRDSSAIDAGAHIGDILRSMTEIAPDGRHHAFEPLPSFASILRRDFPAATVHEVALGDKTGTATFQHVVNDPGYSGLRQREYARQDPIIEQIEVRVSRLDDLIPVPEQIDFIKMDVEGGEYHAMLGGVETIRRCRPVITFEAAKGSTGHYGISAEQLFQLVAERIGMSLSTMDRWLGGSAPYSMAEFRANWHEGPEYFFIAYPG